MNVVVDASAIGLFLLRDEDRQLAEFAEEVCRTARLFVPPVWRTEVASLLLKAFRNRRIAERECDDASRRADILAAAAIIGPENSIGDIIGAAGARSLRAHDATCLQLALALHLPLLTNDRRLTGAALASGVALLLP